jgi:hypothetical protein
MTPLLVSGQSVLLNGRANISARRLAVNQLAALDRFGRRMKNPLSPRLLKKVQMPGGARRAK